MSDTRNSAREALRRVLASPVFPERAKTMQAQLLHGVIVAATIIALLSLLIGVPFVFQQRLLASGMALATLAAALWSWKLCRDGRIAASAHLLIAVLWLLAVGTSLLSQRTEFTMFVPVLFISLLLSGPVLALVVAASAIALFAGMHIALQLGIAWPRLFPSPPQSVLFMSMLYLALAALPVAMLARQFHTTIEDFSQFRSAQRDLRIVTWIWDVVSDQVWWDGDLARLLNVPSGTYSGRFKDYLRYVHPEDREFARQRYIDCVKGRRNFYGGEDRIIWPDGSVHWLGVRGQAFYGADGRAIRLTGVVTDISERKMGEQALAQTRKRLAIAFEASPDSIVVSRFADGRILDVNPAFTRLFGYSLDDARNWTGMNAALWTDPADRDFIYATIREVGEVRDRKCLFRAKSGSVRTINLSANAVEIDGEKCIISVARDVTEQLIAERKLQESEAKYAAFFDTCPDAIAITRGDSGIWIDINPAWTEQTGYSHEEGIGQSALKLNLWANPNERQAAVAEIATHGKLLNYGTRFVRKDGSIRDVLLSAVSLAVKVEGESCIAWIWRDVTEVLRMEREHAQSNERYRTLFDSALDAMAVIAPDGALLDINAFGLRLAGYSREELIGRNMVTLFEPKGLAKAPFRPSEVIVQGQARSSRTARTKDGREFPVELVAGPLPDGNVLAIVRDVSERKRSQSLLQNIARGVSSAVGDDFFRSLVGNLSKELAADYCFIGEILPEDPTRVRTLAFCANGAEAPNFEYSLQGSPCADAIAKRGTVAFPARVCEQFPRDLGLQRLGVQGYVGTSLIDSAGVGVGILVVMSRKLITEIGLWTSVLEIFGARAAAEIQRSHADARLRELNASLEQRVRERTAELELANRELESFSYSVSHDLRAPLRAINGFASLLSVEHGSRLGEEASSLLARITRNTVRMNRLIEDVLEFARAGRGTLNPERMDMRALVDEVIAELRASTGTKAQIVVGEIPPATGDAGIVRQVWHNLIGNALKFSRNTADPRVEVAGGRRGGMIEYLVRDNGAGFDAAHADKMFGVFQRLHTTREFEGAGIGLAIARRIVQRHGGDIAAEGIVGSGATFRFTLPG